MTISLRNTTPWIKVQEGDETTLYRARDERTQAPIVLKVTKSEYPTARELARLRREFALLRELDLPYTPKALALEASGRGLALIMADIGHPTLRELMAARRLDIGAALAVAVSLSDVLAAVHQRRVLHKDVAPSNILVDEDAQKAYLIDFGIAARLSQEAQVDAGSAAIEGTLAYIAPEQTGRMNRAVDLRADLYSLGAVLYEMLTDRPPFPAESQAELVHCHLAREAPPPRELEPAVPAPLSDVVMTLLAKTPEERYQSDAGLRADLAECLEQWKATMSVAPFPLRRFDKATELRPPQRLLGRARDLVALSEALEQARLREPALVIIAGPAGVGKSALAHEMRRLTAHRGGYFVEGRLDPLSRDVPLAPFVQALRELTRQILAEPPQALERWRAELEGALGDHGRILTDLIPELKLIMDARPRPELHALPADQAERRFEMALQGFLRVVASSERPIVMFLDDLQWIDPASSKLLALLLSEGYVDHLLLIGAYRTGQDTEGGRALLATLEQRRRAGQRFTKINLEPLDLARVRSLVAEALTTPAEEVAELALVIHEKTHGNPFFVRQFLAAIHADDLLLFDPTAGAWRWDIERIRRASVTENVVDLMVAELKRLEPLSREALTLASCIGSQFDLQSLARVGGRSAAETAAALWEALRKGLLAPVDSDYRLLEGEGADALADAPDLNVRYRFLHDRIREAAYSLVDPRRRPAIHLAIGRVLRGRGGPELAGDDLLDAVRHLNLGAAEITDAEERRSLARLNLRAGRRARGATAHHAAADYFCAGAALLRDEDWESDRDLGVALHVEGAECTYLIGAASRAAAQISAMLPWTTSAVERAPIWRMRVRVHYALGQSEEALKAGGEGLVELGYPWDHEALRSREALLSELAQIKVNLGDRRIADLVSAPEPHDPGQRAVQEILEAMMLPAYRLGAPFGVVALKGVNFALQHGHSDVSSYLYSVCAYIHVLALGRVEEGLAFLRLSLALYRRRPNLMLRARIDLCAGCCAPMSGSIRDADPYFKGARQAGLDAGDVDMMALACCLETLGKLGAGDQLDDVLDNAEKNVALVRRGRTPRIVTMTMIRQAVAALLGRTRGPASLDDDDFNEDRLRERLNDAEHSVTAFHYHALKLELHYLAGEHEEALCAGDAAEQRIASVSGMLYSKLIPFYRCMAVLALPPAEAKLRAATLRRARADLDALAATAPGSFLSRKVLVDAETARAAGDDQGALRLYERAISLAHEQRSPHLEAMAFELCGKHLLRIGAPWGAGAYLKSARRAYLHWGATARAEAIEAEHAGALPSLGDEAAREQTATIVETTRSGATVISPRSIDRVRDAALVFRAVQAIASEVDLPKVIGRLASLVLENAGAQRGALILSQGEELVVSAVFDGAEVTVDEAHERPLRDASDIAKSVVLYVARSGEPVVIDASNAVTRFADDPYLRSGAPRSILGLPLLHQGKLTGVLYLENRAAPGVFNAARVELLTLLSSQAAIAIANARLILSVRAANSEITRMNEHLEEEVASRTRELDQSNKALLAAKDRLEGELSRREQTELERAALKEQVIEAQRARLAEMSTPVIPVTDEIIVMPLIGAVDRERASQVLTAALDGAQRHRARALILDVTGVKQIDAGVAGALINVASALRLLGTEAVVTGIAPGFARALVDLGMDHAAFTTMGTLKSGMDYALRRCRGRPPSGRAP